MKSSMRLSTLPMRAALFIGACFCFAASVSAQTNPEFGLKVRVQLDSLEKIQPRPVVFGYDPRASDGLEGGIANPAWFDSEVGASEEPWIQDDFGGPDLLLADFGGHYGDFTKIDIRHKPDSLSFLTIYYIFVNTGDKSKTATITWDPAQIPAIVKHIMVRQLNLTSRPEVDMKTTNSYAVQYADNSTTRKEYLELTLYYNRELPSGVEEATALRALSVYPNPAVNNLFVSLSSPSDGVMMYTLLDVAGRELGSGERRISTGANNLMIVRPVGFSGAAFLRVSSENGVKIVPIIFD